MQNSDISASLQIVDALNNHLQLSGHHLLVDQTESFQIHNNHNQPQIQSLAKPEEEQDDFLNYSLDQKSISFIMEENIVIHNQPQNTKQNEMSAISNINLNIQGDSSKIQIKKKRREIFDKYKKVSVQNVLFESNTNTNQFMDTFDQVFKLKSPEKQEKETASTVTAIRSTHSHPIIKQFRSKNAQQEKSSIFKKKENTSNPIHTQKKIQGELNKLSQVYLDVQKKNVVKQIQRKQPLQKKYELDDLHFSMEQRFSIILPSNNPHQISKDDADLENILHSQLFNSQKLHYTIHNHEQTSYNNIQISAMNPSIMINSHRQPSQNTLAFHQISSRMLIRQKSEKRLPMISPGDLISRNLSQQKLKITTNQQEKIFIKQAKPFQILLSKRPEAFKQQRVPKFLRQIRQSNTLLPNFQFKKYFNKVCQQTHSHLKQLIILIQKALNLLNEINSAIKNKKIKVTKAIAILINEHSLQTFLNSKWEQFQRSNIQGISQIKPNQNFVRRAFNFDKIQNALNNYLKIADYYLNIKLNFQDQRSIKKYYDIRLKFWEIQRNIKLISQDLYSESIQRVIPTHYYDFLTFLKDSGKPRVTEINIQKRRQMLAKYHYLKEQQDPLTLSCIGKSVKKKAQIQLYRMSIY